MGPDLMRGFMICAVYDISRGTLLHLSSLLSSSSDWTVQVALANSSISSFPVRVESPVDFYDSSDSGTCASCPLGADCTMSSSTPQHRELKDGFWRQNPMSQNVYQCRLLDACVESACGEGPLCGVFEAGWLSRFRENANATVMHIGRSLC